MGLFDRLLGNRSATNAGGSNSRDGVKVAGSAAEANPKKSDNTFFLDADASSTLGDVNFMRRSNTIRRTFPGTSDSPGNKEMVAEVASMEARLEKMTPGLAGINPDTDPEVNLTGGVPKPVKKTFAQPMSASQLAEKLKGAAVGGVNKPGAPAVSRKNTDGANDQSSTPSTSKPGAIDPFKAMAKDLNG
ncbi:MAG: hypothetical protein VKO19_10555 [Cyanobacteriota bacterium]|nr:hypothetical protein [Cyanobacteriota bacterium]